jgi:hypothetical protein
VDEKERKRRSEMAKYYGPREMFRFVGFLLGWIFLGLVIAVILLLLFDIKKEVFIAFSMVFVITAFAFPFVAFFWTPANSLMNKVIGNKNINFSTISLSSLKQIEKRPWYYYLPSLWGWLMTIILFYLIIQYLSK